MIINPEGGDSDRRPQLGGPLDVRDALAVLTGTTHTPAHSGLTPHRLSSAVLGIIQQRSSLPEPMTVPP